MTKDIFNVKFFVLDCLDQQETTDLVNLVICTTLLNN